MKKQLDKEHYAFGRYMQKARWASVWHQLDEVFAAEPKSVLEIGPGPGLFKAAARAFGLSVATVDIDLELQPDVVASAVDLPFAAAALDVVCAFQMLEHLPYPQSIAAFHEIARVARKAIILSLPDAKPRWEYAFHIPRRGKKVFLTDRPFYRPRPHHFDGEHHWEINKKGFSQERILADFSAPGWTMAKTYRVAENGYHRFFVYRSSRHERPGDAR